MKSSRSGRRGARIRVDEELEVEAGTLRRHTLAQPKWLLRKLTQAQPTDHSQSDELEGLEPKWLRSRY
eukprot:6487093-Amphidinium_carterae.1